MTETPDEEVLCELIATPEDSDRDHRVATGSRDELERMAEELRRESNGFVSYTVKEL
jgi:hypothetical protein